MSLIRGLHLAERSIDGIEEVLNGEWEAEESVFVVFGRNLIERDGLRVDNRVLNNR